MRDYHISGGLSFNLISFLLYFSNDIMIPDLTVHVGAYEIIIAG